MLFDANSCVSNEDDRYSVVHIIIFSWYFITHIALLFVDNFGALIASVAFQVTEIESRSRTTFTLPP
jgi:hypothetical protein